MTSFVRVVATAGVCGALTVGCGAGRHSITVPGAQAGRGPELIEAYGCGSCHTIAGVQAADGRVGPSLDGLASQRLIAGRIANTPQNLVDWIRDPQAIEPGTVMPNLGVGVSEARDIAAYLYRH